MIKKRCVLFLLFLILAVTATAQKKPQPKGLTKEELANYEVEIKKMVHYLQETLNFIGDPSQSVQEKEIVFSQSYSKIFQDDKVQIEDDLDINRSVNVSKDVQAYLKDIDFFFQYATFTFDVQSIANLAKEDGSPYFKVTMNRHLVAKTVTNDSINDVRKRFIEINLDRKNNDLKIASIYTTKVNERESLRYWWNAMPSAWKNYFGNELRINDTIPLKSIMLINESDLIYSYPVLSINGQDTIATDWRETIVRNGLDELYAKLKGLSMIQNVDVSGIRTITTLEPLNELSELTTLDLSGTNVNDLSPLRNANKLKVLKASNTMVDDLSALKYDIQIDELDVSNTEVSNIAVLQTLNKLEKLNISNTRVSDLNPIENCPELAYLLAEGCSISNLLPVGKLEKIVALDLSHTGVRDLSPISKLTSLQSLKISNTPVTGLSALSQTESLVELYCSNTAIADLSPLKNNRRLSKIYCDNTRVDIEHANAFAQYNPLTLVVYDTKALERWWNDLPIYWKAVFSKQAEIDSDPTTEQLHKVINMTRLDLSDNEYIQNLIPVRRLTNLNWLNISNTEVTRLEAVSAMTNLEYLNLENTYIEDLTPLADMKRLKELNIQNTPIHDLSPLANTSHLEIIWADGSAVGLEQVRALKTAFRDVTVVYQSLSLEAWWANIDETWRNIFRRHIGCSSVIPSELELQKIMDLKNLTIEQQNTIQSIEPIRSLIWLEKLDVNGQGIRDIQPLANKTYLSELLLQNNPINDLSPLESDTLLTVLNIENTQVSELSKLEKLPHLRVLNASGTAVKSLKPLSKMTELEELCINNTSVKSISPIENIPSLKLLKIYNTRVKSKDVTSLQQKRFDLNIVYY